MSPPLKLKRRRHDNVLEIGYSPQNLKDNLQVQDNIDRRAGAQIKSIDFGTNSFSGLIRDFTDT